MITHGLLKEFFLTFSQKLRKREKIQKLYFQKNETFTVIFQHDLY